jgi:hypothetical protein
MKADENVSLLKVLKAKEVKAYSLIVILSSIIVSLIDEKFPLKSLFEN